MNERTLSPEQSAHILEVLKSRFEGNMSRHKGLDWARIKDKLESHPEKLWSLLEMEKSGGEPDVIGQDPKTDAFIFCDCSAESPAGRRSLCYDRQAWESRKANKPKGNALDMASAMDIELLDEEQYLALQKLGPMDQKTSTWIKTPEGMRSLGGALFGDYRFGRVFFYHNGAESYYAARGFRGILKL